MRFFRPWWRKKTKPIQSQSVNLFDIIFELPDPSIRQTKCRMATPNAGQAVYWFRAEITLIALNIAWIKTGRKSEPLFS
jgi:hypothetical protein